MKFQDAKDRLKKIANGRYHSISIDVTESSYGDLKTSCRVYVDPSIAVTRTTFLEALDALEEIMTGIAPKGTAEEMPEVEA